MKLIIVGIPITKETVSQEYIDFINDKKTAVIISSSIQNGNDYITSKIGHDLLLSSGKHITYLDLWSSEKRKNPEEVFNSLCKIIESYEECYYIVPGSPFYSDEICSKLIKKYNPLIIDTKSSEQIIKDIFGENAKVISCLGPNYKYFGVWNIINKIKILFCLLIYVKIYIIKLGETNYIKEMSKKEFKYIMNNKTDELNYSIFAFMRK